MEKILLYIKHNMDFLWRLIEFSNATVFRIYYGARLKAITGEVFKEYTLSGFLFRELNFTDLENLEKLFVSQESEDLEYFQPHGFDLASIKRQYSNSSFLMMGVFIGYDIVGYFFLRFFINRKCFVGRLIDKNYRGIGIGQVMNNIMYEIAWRMKFRCLSTISKNNTAVIKAHSKNNKMVKLKELKNNYLLVEFVKSSNASEKDI